MINGCKRRDVIHTTERWKLVLAQSTKSFIKQDFYKTTLLAGLVGGGGVLMSTPDGIYKCIYINAQESVRTLACTEKN